MQLEVGQVGGLRPKFGLYTVPGQIYYETTRETVLRRADALVFVVDSQAARLEDNLESWRAMQQQLIRINRPIQTMPLVVQLNKRDMPDALPVAQLTSALRLGKTPYFEAVAMKGIGVPQTLQEAIRLLLIYVNYKLQLTRPQGAAQ
jgi:hypothetical protein